VALLVTSLASNCLAARSLMNVFLRCWQAKTKGGLSGQPDQWAGRHCQAWREQRVTLTCHLGLTSLVSSLLP
jgi:hypothetical protein